MCRVGSAVCGSRAEVRGRLSSFRAVAMELVIAVSISAWDHAGGCDSVAVVVCGSGMLESRRSRL